MKSLEDLKKIREAAQKKVCMRGINVGTKILVSMGTFGINAGARPVMNKFVEDLCNQHLYNVTVSPVDCKGEKDNPIVEVVEGDKITTYGKVDEKAVDRIIKEHILGGKIVKEYVLGKATT